MAGSSVITLGKLTKPFVKYLKIANFQEKKDIFITMTGIVSYNRMLIASEISTN